MEMEGVSRCEVGGIEKMADIKGSLGTGRNEKMLTKQRRIMSLKIQLKNESVGQTRLIGRQRASACGEVLRRTTRTK